MLPNAALEDAAENPAGLTRSFELPGGLVDDDGRVHRDVELASLTGLDQSVLQGLAGSTPLAVAVTVLLSRAVRRVGSIVRPDVEVIRGLLVGDREYLLLKLFELTIGPSTWLTLRCPHAQCAQPMDLKVELAALPVEKRPVSSRYFSLGHGPQFRLPTGRDQELAGAIFREDPERAASSLLECCLASGGGESSDAPPQALPSDELAAAIEARMSELAPGLDIELDAVCPECGSGFLGRLDLTPRLLGELCGSARHLEQEVHVIAWNYHWSERGILGLTRQKRRRYVELIERQREAALAS